MSAPSAKKTKFDPLPICPYGGKCYRKNPAHLKEFAHPDTSITPAVTTTTDDKNILPVCPFGATCYRKNLLHFAQLSHPFDLLNPDADSSDEEEKDEKKRKRESEEEDDGDKTEEYDSDDETMYDVKLEKTFSKMTDEEKRLTIERAFELKEKLQEKLKKTREEAEQRKKEIEQLQNKVSEGILLMEGEEEVLKGTQTKYFELFPERSYKQGSAAEVHFRLAESQFYRLLSGYAAAKVSKVEYVCNPVSIDRFNKAREELKRNRGEEYANPILAFHGTAPANIVPICEGGFKMPGQAGFQHATDNGYYGCGAYFSEYSGFSIPYLRGSTKLLLCQILQGKVYHCPQMIQGAGLQDGFDSHCSPSKKELILFRSDHILPQYIVHYKIITGEFEYTAGISKEAMKKKFAKIGKLYKKAADLGPVTCMILSHGTEISFKNLPFFSPLKFQFIGQMVDTPLAMEALIKRFDGSVCKKSSPATGLFVNGYPAPSTFDGPTLIICSLAEMEGTTPSAELQAYKNLGYTNFHREDFLYDSIIDGAAKPLADYVHD